MDNILNVCSSLKRQGKDVLGCFPLYLPVELFHSFGLTPVTLWGMKPGNVNLTVSDRHLQNFTCGIARCLAECVLGNGSDCIDALFMYNACDTLRNLPEIIEKGLNDKGMKKQIFRLHIPAVSSDRSGVKQYLEHRIKDLVKRLEEYTGRTFSPGDFGNSVELYRKQRALSRDLETLAENGKVPFRQIHDILVQAHYMPVEDHLVLLEKNIPIIREQCVVDTGSIPVMISGIQVPRGTVIEMMEEAGLSIVANDVATLRRSYEYSPDISSDPVQYYQDFYFNHYPCTTMLSEGDRRLEVIRQTVHEKKVRGVIFLMEKFCEYEYFEIPHIDSVLKDEGIRTLCLEFGIEDSADAGTIKNRIAAFAEMLSMQMSA